MGMTYSPLIQDDPFQTYFFPGTANGEQVSFSNLFKVDWVPLWSLPWDIYYDAEAYRAGFPLKIFGEQKLFLNLSLVRILLDYGRQPLVDSESGEVEDYVESWNRNYVLRGGIEWRHKWHRSWLNDLTASAGWGMDFVKSKSVSSLVAEGEKTLQDWSLGATARLYQSTSDAFRCDIGFQVAENFISKGTFYYVNPDQGDPLPRQALWSIAGACEWRWRSVPLLRVHAAKSHNVLLVDDQEEYIPFAGSLFDPGDTSVGLEITVREILTWRLGELYEYRWDYNTDGYITANTLDTVGFGIQTTGMKQNFKSHPALRQNGWLGFLIAHVNLYYNYSLYTDGDRGHGWVGTEYHELGIRFEN